MCDGFETRNGSPMATMLFFLLGLLSDFQYTKTFFISQPVVMKLWIQTDDSIINFCTVRDF